MAEVEGHIAANQESADAARTPHRVQTVPACSASDANPREQYEELLQHEQNLNTFLVNFEASKAAKQAEQQQKQAAVNALLERIKQAQAIKGTPMPSQPEYKQLQVGRWWQRICHEIHILHTRLHAIPS